MALAASPAYPGKSLYNVEMHWKTEAGEDFYLKQLAGKHVISSMMYLTCKASCPITLQKLRSIENDLKSSDKTADFIIVSFDPETDTPQKMLEFKKAHKLGENWHFLNGSEQEVRKMALLLGFNFKRIDGTTEYSHSNRISLINQEGEIIATIDSLDAGNSILIDKFK